MRLKIADRKREEAHYLKKKKKKAWCLLDNGPWIYFFLLPLFLLIQEGSCCQIPVIIYVLVFLWILLTLQFKALQCFVTRLTVRQALRQTDGLIGVCIHSVSTRQISSEGPVSDYLQTAHDNMCYSLTPLWQSAVWILIPVISIICCVKMICVENDMKPTWGDLIISVDWEPTEQMLWQFI